MSRRYPSSFEEWQEIVHQDIHTGYFVNAQNETLDIFYISKTSEIDERYEVVTHQSNGWDRINNYYPDGTVDETFRKTKDSNPEESDLKESAEMSSLNKVSASKRSPKYESTIKSLKSKISRMEKDFNTYVNNPIQACLYCKKNKNCAPSGGDCTFIYDKNCEVDLATADYPGNPDKGWTVLGYRNNLMKSK